MLLYWFELRSFWILSCLAIIRIPVEHWKLTLFELQYEHAHSKLMRLYLWIMWILWASDHSGAHLRAHLSCNWSAPAFPVWWCVVRLSADPEFVCVFKDGSLSSCKNKLSSSCFRLKVLMSSVSRSNSLFGAVGIISLFKGIMAASSARPEYVWSSNVEESACGDVYLHLIFQNSKHIPEKVITWL